MSSLLKIGELAKQTGLSVRTLHYYDEIGLLVPSHRTEADHRLYSDADIMRLQQILSLRQLGFSLKEIQDCLENPEYSLPQVIELHCDRIRQQIALSQTLLKRLNGIAQELQTTQSVAVETLIETMETITMTEQYFTPQQQTLLANRFHQRAPEWQEMLGLARDVMTEGTELTSVKVYALARYWQQLMRSLIGSDGDLYESLIQLYQHQGGEAASWGTLDADTFDYILKAVAFASLAEEVVLQPSTQNYTPEALQVLDLGQSAVHALNLDVFGTEGILLGLLAEGTTATAQILTTAGLTVDSARQAIINLLGERTAPQGELPRLEQLPVAPRAKRVMELARAQAHALGQSHVAPEHLLLGILEEDKETPEKYAGVAIRVLRDTLASNLAQLEQQIRSRLLE
jgi:DNA-binding transcriptional MerR regulator